ncbi:unnamed protein product [Adineta steineri]|uniref:Uncharacterized protein n=1 Tax=Adineta steineri TaxID=433720 RepID=A0A814WYM4_9BILA|nr:unnamed protein product [Adineta steineri]CAF1406896.1 unnamed protein product [Adineta steineri]CAF1409189.1 unnamed protein product [Adineta steineri]CAF3783269.1 unnamed protein product [Adineta steineri]CAF3837649.1 unnamed protein product [Adineta steineri]
MTETKVSSFIILFHKFLNSTSTRKKHPTDPYQIFTVNNYSPLLFTQQQFTLFPEKDQQHISIKTSSIRKEDAYDSDYIARLLRLRDPYYRVHNPDGIDDLLYADYFRVGLDGLYFDRDGNVS